MTTVQVKLATNLAQQTQAMQDIQFINVLVYSLLRYNCFWDLPPFNWDLLEVSWMLHDNNIP
jgi:hypothetical protein